MTKKQRIKEIEDDIRFFEMQLRELLLESGILTDRKRLAIEINMKKLDELQNELVDLLKEE